MQPLIGSVGLGGRNRSFDVAAVQRLLQRAGLSPGPIDQRCGIRTIHAIERFQHGFLHRPDGRVDVGGPTWRHLQQAGQRAPAAGHPAAPRPAAAPPAARPIPTPAPPAHAPRAPAPTSPAPARPSPAGHPEPNA